MNIKLVYKSKSGFTKRYAEWIARETDCELIPLKRSNAASVSGCDIFIYGMPGTCRTGGRSVQST